MSLPKILEFPFCESLVRGFQGLPFLLAMNAGQSIAASRSVNMDWGI